MVEDVVVDDVVVDEVEVCGSVVVVELVVVDEVDVCGSVVVVDDVVEVVEVVVSANPTPKIAKSYGFSLLSLLGILMVAVRLPTPFGSKVTVNVVEPPPGATGLVGGDVTVKSPALVPVILIVPKVRGPVPVFIITYVLVEVASVKYVSGNFVQSDGEGDVSPSVIDLLFP